MLIHLDRFTSTDNATYLNRANIWLLAGVGAKMNFQIFCTREALSTLAALMRLFLRMGSHMHQHLVACIEAPVLPQTVFPSAVVQSAKSNDGVLLRDVTGQVIQLEEHAAHKRETRADTQNHD